MIDERRFQVGYNAEEIRVFIPRELRKLAECPSSEVCPQFISEPCSIKEAYFVIDSSVMKRCFFSF